jgi:hydrogenase maturation protease
MTGGDRPRTALVVCVGNDLAGDDGAGPEVHDRLVREGLPGAVRLRCLATGGISLLDEIDGDGLLVVVDAVQFGAPAGTVHVRRWSDLPVPLAGAVSAHGIGLREAIEIAARLYPERLPHDAYLVGVEGTRFDQLGEDLSAAVAAGVARAASVVRTLVTGCVS